jgi:hypothetical protein
MPTVKRWTRGRPKMLKRLELAIGALLLLAASLSLLAAACGGGGEETPSPVPPTGSPLPPEVQVQLKRMVLQPDDMLVGFNPVDEAFSTNEESASSADDPQGHLADLQRWGRILGYEVYYESGEPATVGQTMFFSVQSTASIYESSEGASASFADAVEVARTADWPVHFVGLEYVEVEEVPVSGLADEAMWLRIGEKGEPGEQVFAFDFVMLRQGPGRGSLQIGSFGTEGSKAVVEQLARAQADRMRSGLD